MRDWVYLLPGSHTGAIYRQIYPATQILPQKPTTACGDHCPTCDRPQPIQDIREYWAAGRPFYDPGQIEVPVLLIHGEWDVDVPLALAQDYFAHLSGSPDKRWLELGEATHMLMLEKNRGHAYQALVSFLSEA